MTFIKRRSLLIYLLVFAVFMAFSLPAGADGLDLSNPEVNEMFTKRDFNPSYSGFSNITLADGASGSDSRAVSISGDTVTIGQDGVYRLSGSLSDGQIVVQAPEKGKVQLVLDNADISCVGGAAINVLSADKVFITTAAGSVNSLRSTGELSGDAEAAIYSKVDICFNGEGSLSVSSEHGHGIATKDDLKICSGEYSISAKKHGLSGKDSIRIAGGNISVSAESDALHTEHEKADKGFVFISGGSLRAESLKDGIDATNYVRIIGGTADISARSDGINVAGEDGQANRFELAGGSLRITAQEDGIDSNGSIAVTGGELYISAAPRGGDGALDHESGCEISGGTVIAACSGDMAANFSAASNQGSILYRFEKPHAAGEEIGLEDEDGSLLASFTPQLDYQAVVISCAAVLDKGCYTVSAGDESAGIEMNGYIYDAPFGFGGRLPPEGMPGGKEPPPMPDGKEPPEFPEGGKPRGPFAPVEKP